MKSTDKTSSEKVLKKDSEAWRLAKKYARRKYTNSAPVDLSPCGEKVTMFGLVYGNTWQYTKEDLRTLLGNCEH